MRSRKKTAIVPRAVRTATFVAAIPSVVACGGPDPILSLGNIYYGVAAVAYCCFDAMAVADAAFGDVNADVAMSDVQDEGDTSSEAAASDAPVD